MKKMAHKKFVLLAILSMLPCLLVANTARSDSITEFKLVSGDAKATSWFSSSVAIDGEILVIGAPFDDDGAAGAGAAYVFQYDQSTSMWIEKAKLTAGSDAAQGDQFGFSVAIAGKTIAVGAHRKDGAFMDSGLVYVFTYDGTTWNELAKLAASDPSSFAEFGWSVFMSNDTLVVGAPLGNLFMGAAYVFTNGVNGWQEKAILTASDAAPGDQFGRSVTIGGDVAVIGAPFEGGACPGDPLCNSGSAYVFRYDGTTWSEEEKLVASDAALEDQFGSSVAISGNLAAIGAPFDDDACPGDPLCNSGSAYVFRYVGTTWREEKEKLVASDAALEDQFGSSVAISGNLAAIGAPFEGGACPGDPLCNSGSAYVFRYDGTTWGHETKLVASDAEFDDQFGWSIGLDSDKVLVGALFGDGEKVTNSGAAYVYPLSSSNQPPTAEAIADPEEAKEGDRVFLIGSGSEDPDGDPLTYQWEQIETAGPPDGDPLTYQWEQTETAGPHVELSDPTAPDPFFIAPELTNGCATLVFQLTVTEDVDGGLTSDAVTVKIEVLPDNTIHSKLERKHRHWLFWHKYTFEGVKDEVVTLDLQADPDGLSRGERATLILKDKIRRVRLYKKDRGKLPNTVTATLPADGEYVVYVVKQPWFCRGKNFRGDYILTLEGTCGKLRKSFGWKKR